MEPFRTLRGRAAAFMADAINTDVIYPARFLLLTERRGLGRYLFHDYRRGADGEVTGEFVLDRPEFRHAQILIAGAAFGCGSSREQAVWTLLDAGVRCIVAPSFGEIFHANCYENGLLPIALPNEVVARLAVQAEAGAEMCVDLAAQTITPQGETPIPFSIAPNRKQALMLGLDSIDEVLRQKPLIEAFERRHRRSQPWLFVEEPTS
jgi:3-isopropylmalate/(R)-2-methylmalate dehydratase small subunit